MLTAAIVSALLVPFVCVLIRMWVTRRDVWITMHDASYFQVGDTITLNGTGPSTQRACVLKVTRYALKVRPMRGVK